MKLLIHTISALALTVMLSGPLSADETTTELSAVNISVNSGEVDKILTNFIGENVIVNLSSGATVSGKVKEVGSSWTVITDVSSPGDYYFTTVKNTDIVAITAREKDGSGKARKLNITK